MGSTVVAIRHGRPESEGYAEDELRPLSKEGKDDIKHLGKKLQAAGILPNCIVASPYVRATESAEVLSELFSIPFQIEPGLGQVFDRQKLMHHILTSGSNNTVFFVGHAPTLSEFVNDLAGKDVLPQGLAKSSAAVVTFFDTIQFGKGCFVQMY